MKTTHCRALGYALAACVLISGCGTLFPQRGEAERRPAQVNQAAPAPKAQGAGGYYQDDGPGENPPNLAAIADPKPIVEPLNRYANRPYTVLGKLYTPYTELTPYRARGIASWYGRKFHGQRTSSGETYDMYAMTAAHPVLPIPSYARVTSLSSNKSVIVRINDRGPFYSDRLIDLSYAAAYRLGIAGAGSGVVEVASINPDAQAEVAAAPAAPEKPAPSAVIAATREGGGIYLQLAAFSTQDNAENFLAKTRQRLGVAGETLSVFSRDGLFRVHLGPYANQEEARAAAEQVRQALDIAPLLLLVR